MIQNYFWDWLCTCFGSKCHHAIWGSSMYSMKCYLRWHFSVRFHPESQTGVLIGHESLWWCMSVLIAHDDGLRWENCVCCSDMETLSFSTFMMRQPSFRHWSELFQFVYTWFSEVFSSSGMEYHFNLFSNCVDLNLNSRLGVQKNMLRIGDLWSGSILNNWSMLQ